jgi:hypothetical protein
MIFVIVGAVGLAFVFGGLVVGIILLVEPSKRRRKGR